MAFQAPTAITNIASVTSELWPAMKSTLTAPWRPLPQTTAHTKLNPRIAPQQKQAHTRPSVAESVIPSAAQLPECLASVPLASLRSFTQIGDLSKQGGYGILSLPSSKNLWSSNPFLHAPPKSAHSARMFSTLPPFRFAHDYRTSIRKLPCLIQRRSIMGNSSNQNQLAHLEQTANNHPGSATAQHAFYSALLRTNMPAIVIERFQTGRYASSTACEAAFQQALERVAQTEGVAGYGASPQMQGRTSGMTNAQHQAVGQAVAAQSRGGNISMARGKDGAAGAGVKESPLYVVVEESLGGTIFKWVKFLFYFGLVAYFSLVIVTVAVETTGILKKVGGNQSNEAQPQHQTVRFTDVHGCDEAKEELQELVEFLKNPEKFSTLGGKLPKGVLLVGPPGTGKTLLARAVAGEAGVPFFFMSGAEFDEIYVGVGAKRVRDLFSNARAKAPAIIFIDELDAIGGKRNERDPAYVKQSLNQLLTELDGFSQETGVIILAATNFPQLLDKALTRPGRFDRNVVVPLPDVRGRVAILKHHMKNVQVGTDVDETIIARGTSGFSGAQLENLVNQAAVRASRNHAKKVSMVDFDWAKDKIIMGAERRSAVIHDKDKLMTAYHEGGHALVAMFTKGHPPMYKATIMPRGQALGMTSWMEEMDKVSRAKEEYIAQIDSAMGGKVAEELVYGPDQVTSGCLADLQQATRVAFAMVTQLGMSDVLGNVDLNSDYADLSSETKQQIEREVRRLVEEGYQRATKILTEKRKELDILAKALVEYEVLNLDEMNRVLKGEKLKKLTVLPKTPMTMPEIVGPLGIGGGKSGTHSSEAAGESESRTGGSGGATL